MTIAVFDGHLDLALNALEFKRDLSLSLEVLRKRQTPEAIEKVGTPTVTFEQLRQGGVKLVVSTLLARAKPWADSTPVRTSIGGDWPTQDMAYAVAQGQLAWYRRMQQLGRLHIITTSQQLEKHWQDVEAPLGVILTLEGSDPIVEPEQLHVWHEQGLRTLMLAHFGRSFYAHGTPSTDPANAHDVEGPLSEMGVALLKEMGPLQMPLDLTHLSDQSFFEAVECYDGPIYSSHTACRALVGLPRNHSDDQLRLILERGGMIGLPLCNQFLESNDRALWKRWRKKVSLDRVVDHVDHICQLAGSAEHVAIGSDLDGGFGREHIPHEMDSIADMVKLPGGLAGALEHRGFSDDDIRGVLGENWLRFYKKYLDNTSDAP